MVEASPTIPNGRCAGNAARSIHPVAARSVLLGSLVSEVNRGREPGLGPDHPGGVPLAREILGQRHVTGTEAVHAAVAESNLHLSLERDDVLPTGRVVPVVEMAG